MRRLYQYVLLFALVLVSGCDEEVTSTQPLSDPMTSEPDPAVFGHWRASVIKDGKRRDAHLFVGKSWKENPEGVIQAAHLFWDTSDRSSDYLPWFLSTTRIGNSTYASLFAVDLESLDNTLKSSHNWSYRDWSANNRRIIIVFRYKVSDGRMHIWTSNRAVRDKLIESGELKISGKRVTAESLAKYLRSNDGTRLFSEPYFSYDKQK